MPSHVTPCYATLCMRTRTHACMHSCTCTHTSAYMRMHASRDEGKGSCASSKPSWRHMATADSSVSSDVASSYRSTCSIASPSACNARTHTRRDRERMCVCVCVCVCVTGTHTRMHTRTHACTHASTFACVHTLSHAQTHARMHMHPRMCTRTRTCAHAELAHVCAHALAHAHTCTRTHARCTHALTRNSHKRTSVCAHAHMRTCTHVHMHTCAHVHMHACAHVHMYTCTPACLYRCTQAHTGTHTTMNWSRLLQLCCGAPARRRCTSWRAERASERRSAGRRCTQPKDFEHS